ncbi:MAG: hypothetical protein ACYSUI_25980 [Planctomycetota bacterium]|jgi:hypothetical protein
MFQLASKAQQRFLFQRCGARPLLLRRKIRMSRSHDPGGGVPNSLMVAGRAGEDDLVVNGRGGSGGFFRP